MSKLSVSASKKKAIFRTQMSMTKTPRNNEFLGRKFNSYLEEMALHTNMRNGISHKIATILSKFSFLDMSNTSLLHNCLSFSKALNSVWTVSSSVSTRELTSCLLAFSQLISGRAPDERGAERRYCDSAELLWRLAQDSIFSPKAARWWAALNYKGRRLERRY